jgi:hypothetical protein
MRRRARSLVSQTFTSLRIRNFRLFFVGQLVSQSGSWLTLIAQTLLVLRLTDNSGIAVGALLACQFGPVLALGQRSQCEGPVPADGRERGRERGREPALALVAQVPRQSGDAETHPAGDVGDLGRVGHRTSLPS